MPADRHFDGDDDEPTQLVQHMAREDALRMMLEASRAYARLAMALAGEEVTLKCFVTGRQLDYWTFAEVHDVLAAYWRFTVRRVHPALPFEGERESAICRDAWLDWLRAEIADWVHRPDLVRALILSASATSGAKAGEAARAARFLVRERCRNMLEDRSWEPSETSPVW